jgi:hypothetical protein
MTILAIDREAATIRDISVTKDTLIVDLADGRTVSVPLSWYPRLLQATNPERGKWRLIGQGEGIHWPDLDEDVSAENILAGKPSGESQVSFKRWLENRRSRNRPARQRLPK